MTWAVIPVDDMMADIQDDAEGEDKPEGDEEIEDRVVDLEDALDDLKAEFEKMMSDKEDGGEEDREASQMIWVMKRRKTRQLCASILALKSPQLSPNRRRS